MDEPSFAQRVGGGCRYAGGPQPGDDPAARLAEGRAVQFDGPHGVRERRDRVGSARRVPADEKPIQRRDEEITFAKGRFQKAHPVQRAVGSIAGEVEDEIDDFPPREDRAALFVRRAGARGDSGGHGAVAEQGRLAQADERGTSIHAKGLSREDGLPTHRSVSASVGTRSRKGQARREHRPRLISRAMRTPLAPIISSQAKMRSQPPASALVRRSLSGIS